jgi:type IV pilus assembly protein PilX
MSTSTSPSPGIRAAAPRQAGIALIIALILLVVLSLLAAMSVRNAASSEGVSGNVRRSQLAAQAAETGLRYCEDAIVNLISAGTATFNFSTPSNSATAALSASLILDYVAGTPTSEITSNWDTTAAGPLIVPLSSVNPSGVSTTFARPPECMIERLSPSTAASYSSNFTITARGFGPEVPADSNRSRPVGSEVWLQSTIELN